MKTNLLVLCVAAVTLSLQASCPAPNFAAQVKYGTGAGPQALVVGNFNGDGILDLAIVNNSDNTLTVLLGYGDGTFYARPPLGLRRAPAALAVGDFNGDGRPDLVVANQGDDSVSILLGIGNGDFQRHTTVSVGAQPVAVAVGDFNGDGKLDVAAANLFGAVTVLFGDGTGLVGSPISVPAGQNPGSIAVGDLNGDGAPDLVVVNVGSDDLSIRLADLGGGFLSSGTVPASGGVDLVLADFNRDGNLDVAVAGGPQGTVGVHLGNGDGTFKPGTSFPAGNGPEALAVGDFNGDGKLDLALANESSDNVSILLGDGEGGFAAPVNLAAGHFAGSIRAGYFNGDGGLDLAVGNFGNNNVSILLNTCPLSPVDLRITDIEVTQAIQDLGNTVALVAGKRTFARVHADANVLVSRVTALLNGYDQNGVQLGLPLRPNNSGGFIDLSPTPDRARIDDSFYFELPVTWIQAGVITLKAEIKGDVPDANNANDVISRLFTFQATKPLKLYLVDYPHKNDRGYTVAAPAWWLDLAESNVRRTFPIARLNVTRTSFVDDQADFTGPFLPCVKRALSRIQWWRQTFEPNLPGVIVYGFTEECGGGIAECIPGWTAVGSADVIAHEIGHLMGRHHVSCTPDPNDEGGPDTSYPYPMGIIGGPINDTTRFYGFDPGDHALKFPVPTHVVLPTLGDIMTYCDDRWYSDYNYTHIRDYIQANNIIPAAAPMPYVHGDFLSVYGGIDLATMSVSLPSLSRQSQVGEIPPLVAGPFRIRLVAANNSVLADYQFTPEVGTEGGTVGLIAQIVPFVPGTRRITIYSDNQARELISVPVSANAPSIALTAPAAGLSLPAAGLVTIRWNGADVDGDALTYSLLYSFDNRATWHALAVGVAADQITIDSSQLQGTAGAASGYFRVVASDGVLTGSADSAAFSIAGKAPVARIIEPVNLRAYEYGQTVTLEGVGQDLEDGTLEDGSLVWTSNRDGVLGTGHLLHASRLSVGPHHITLAATDIDGNTTTTTVVVYVGYKSPTISCPSNIITNAAAGQCWSVVTYPAPVATDNLPGVTTDCTPPSGSVFWVGTTTVACRAVDVDGNIAGCTFTVTVVDTTPPVITCNPDILVQSASPTGVVVTFAPTATDACDTNPVVTCTPASGSTFPVGSTLVTCTATDASGNSSSCTFIVTVQFLENLPTPESAFHADFNSGVPPGVTLFGQATVSDGFLKLTVAQAGQFGIAYVDDFNGGHEVNAFRATFKAALFGSTCCGLPADGFSFNLVPAATVRANPGLGEPAEEGLSEGLAVNFDTWDNGGGEAPAIEVKWLGQIIASAPFQSSQSPRGINNPTDAAREVVINLDADGTIDVSYGGVMVLNNVPTPYRASTIGAPKWVIGARTGLANDNHWIGNLNLQALAGAKLCNDFNSGIPAGMTLFGDARVDAGRLKLYTIPETNGFGIAYLQDFSGGQFVKAFRATFTAALFGSTCCGPLPADGFSFNLVPAATVLSNPGYNQPAEEGLVDGLAVNFDTFDNGGGEAPAIEVKWLGQIIASAPVQASQSPAGIVDPLLALRDVVIELRANGHLDVFYGGTLVLNDVPTPYDPAVIRTPVWVLGARVGAANDNFWFDDLCIATLPVPGVPIPDLFNTGVDALAVPLLDNALDPHYQLISGGSNAYAATSLGGFPIGPWLADDAVSAWIGPTPSTEGPNALNASANYIYQTRFDLTGRNPATAVIEGRWATDNNGTDILINGLSTGQSNPFQFTTWTPFRINHGFIPGINTLTFAVNNGFGEATASGPTGLRVEMHGTALPGCIDFQTMAPVSLPTPWVYQGFTFLARDPFMVPLPSAGIQSYGAFTGLTCGWRLEVTLPGPCDSVDLTLVYLGVPAIATGYNGSGTVVATAKMIGPRNTAETITLNGSGISRIVIVASADETGLLSLCCRPRSTGPRMTSITHTGGTVTLRFSTIPGRSYRAEFKNDLSDAVWAPVAPAVIATGASLTITDAPGSLPHRFYRGVLLP